MFHCQITLSSDLYVWNAGWMSLIVPLAQTCVIRLVDCQFHFMTIQQIIQLK